MEEKSKNEEITLMRNAIDKYYKDRYSLQSKSFEKLLKELENLMFVFFHRIMGNIKIGKPANMGVVHPKFKRAQAQIFIDDFKQKLELNFFKNSTNEDLQDYLDRHGYKAAHHPCYKELRKKIIDNEKNIFKKFLLYLAELLH